MSDDGGQTSTDGSIPFNLSVAPGGTSRVTFDSRTRSMGFNGANIVGWSWMIDSVLASSASNFPRLLAAGTHTVSLLVTDSRGVQSLPPGAQATIVVTESAPYTLTELGNLGGLPTTAYALNHNGQVVGNSYTGQVGGFAGFCPCPINHAFLWSAGTITDLGVPANGLNSLAYGINDSGQVVGSYGYPGVFGGGFSYTNGVFTLITPQSGGGSDARAINVSGQIVGAHPPGDGSFRAYRITNGVLTDVGTLGGTNSQALGVNATGQVVGWAQISGGAQHAFLSDGNSMTDLGTLTGTNSQSLGIDNAGRIVGFYFSQVPGDSTTHAFLYSSGQMTDIGTLGGSSSQADGISNGKIVGWARTALNAQHAFVWSGGTMSDLNNLVVLPMGVSLMEATAINDVGQIVANGTDGRAYLLTPK